MIELIAGAYFIFGLLYALSGSPSPRQVENAMQSQTEQDLPEWIVPMSLWISSILVIFSWPYMMIRGK